MNLVVESKFQQQLENILLDLKNVHLNEDRTKIFNTFVEKRLHKALKSYYSELEKTEKYLEYRDNINLLKKYERVMR